MAKTIINLVFIAWFIYFNLSCSKDDSLVKGSGPIEGGDYYVATWGDDTNPGTFESPWATWQKAFDMANAGDIVYFRGGVYKPATSAQGNNITIIEPDGYIPRGHSGTAGNPICYFNYPGETPILDCSLISTTGNFNTALQVYSASYLKFRGLIIRNVYQRRKGVQAFGFSFNLSSHYSLENMTFHNISGNAVRFGSNAQYLGLGTDTLRFINCDVFNCKDTLSGIPYNYADGFKGDGEKGGYIYFYGCRVWDCSDDGFDISGPAVKIFDNCWAFNMGLGIGEPDDGNGFKVGGYRDSISVVGVYMTNCISANNFRFAIHGLDYTPYYRNNARYYNNFFYHNMDGPWAFSNPSKPFINDVYKNNVSYKHTVRNIGVIGYPYLESHNTWDIDPTKLSTWYRETDTVTVTDDDFQSLNIGQLLALRKADNSLPDVTFGRLKSGSDLVGAGINVGMSTLPDIGIDWAYLDKRK